jgi:hypothetical protein
MEWPWFPRANTQNRGTLPRIHVRARELYLVTLIEPQEPSMDTEREHLLNATNTHMFDDIYTYMFNEVYN